MDEIMVTNANTMSKSEMQDVLRFVQGILTAIKSVEDGVEDVRRSTFQAYAGIEFTQGFLPYFNERFGKASDVVIEIQMLNDETLIGDFFNQQMLTLGKQVDTKIEGLLSLIDQFWDFWKDTLPVLNYAEFYKAAVSLLDTNDNVIMLHRKMGPKQDPFMTRAEMIGDSFVKESLAVYPGRISDSDIAALRAKMTQNTGNVLTTKKAKLL
jgi:hypothetical protein